MGGELKEIANSTNAGVGNYSGGTTVWSGNEKATAWSADMYNGTEDKAPDVILGDFQAERQGGRMVGVFGTELDE